ncbi:MAG: LamG-like jellyroll fold domain-containing protein [Candidatus Latescibacterota bacterium]|nr:LamG-like jellyroll fold domain-containing protein [Candidatus Latescibacterota bacterium]
MTERILTCPELVDKLTVEALVDCRRDGAEALQVLVSKWRPPDSFDRFAAHDAGGTDGLDSTGYFGAVFDGRYVYFSPEMHGDSSTHGVVLRYDTLADFGDVASYAAHDASETDGLDTRGFYGAVFDGRYVYFVPRQIDLVAYHSRVLRLDTSTNFRDESSWSAFDVGEQHSQQSAAFDGRYIYFCPGFDGDPATEGSCSGRVIRFDTTADFKSRSSYTSIDIRQWLGAAASCFDGAAFDGRYIYFVPLSSGRVVRYDTRREFDLQSSWQSFDARAVGMGMNVGAVFDGRHLYFCAYGHARIVRFDTSGEFTDPKCWESHEAGETGGLATTGFDGGFFDGRFVYFQPFFLRDGVTSGRGPTFHSHYLRYDPARAFDDPSSWQAWDASATDGLHSVGYNGGAFDGRYFYAAPWQQGPRPDASGQFITHGIVLRCDTLGDCGSFSLRYCDYGHNGGLNAAVPGPSFVVNTVNGALSVASHRTLSAGRHHLAGTYDGAVIELFIDGELRARRQGHGRIVSCDEAVVLGGIRDGLGRFHGDILEAVVRNTADGEFAFLKKGGES